jgi:hypothetical protein
MSTTLSPIACRSPQGNEWIRVKPGPESQFNTPVLRDPSSGELYLVVSPLWPPLADRLTMVCPRLCFNQDGEMFIWPVPTPTPGGGDAPWQEIAVVLASLAERHWCRVVTDEAAGHYVVSTLEEDDALPPPEWPPDDFLDVLYAAFRDRLITSEHHPLIANRSST